MRFSYVYVLIAFWLSSPLLWADDRILSRQPLTDAVSQKFLEMDADDSATVSISEYMDKAIASATERFDKIDANRDGEATPEEYKDFRRKNWEWWKKRFKEEKQFGSEITSFPKQTIPPSE